VKTLAGRNFLVALDVNDRKRFEIYAKKGTATM
jgi:hypothetical protein